MYNKNEIMRIVFEESTELIFVFHENGDIFGANPRAKEESGYNENIYAMNIADIFSIILSSENNKIVILDDELKKYEKLSSFETVAYCNNQTCFPVLLNYNKINLEHDIFGICHAVNISERKSAIKEKKKALNEITEVTKVKNEFIANVTHELRTPLNGIKGLISGLKETDLDIEQRKIIDIVIHCCDNMTKIINDILDISKIEAGRMTIEKQEFDLDQFLKNIIDVNSHIISEKGLKFVVNIGKSIPLKVIGDELRLGQIINNFLSNAIKFTAIGSITLEVVKTFESNDEIELFFVINDTGIGIAEDKMNRLFIPFSQIDGSITRHFGGTGLGLSICHQLVELMNGSIQVDSEEGKGSTFSFTVKLELPEGSSDSMNWMPIDSYLGFKNSELDDYKETEDILIESLEKLSISVEMGTWERAEAISDSIKRLMPEEKKELTRAAFKIVLAVRKCDYDKSINAIRGLQDMLGIKCEKIF